MQMEMKMNNTNCGNGPTRMEVEKNPKLDHHKKRRIYTDNDREMVIEADQLGGRSKRLQVARSLGMAPRTADYVVKNFKLKQRHHHEEEKKDRACWDEAAKHEASIIQTILDWFHNDANLSLKEIFGRVNLEILREILVNAQIPLEEGENLVNHPIRDISRYLAIPSIQQMYNEKKVNQEATISGWLDGLIISRKHIYMIDNDKDKLDRLRFGRGLLAALNDHNAKTVFIDQVPFSVTVNPSACVTTGFVPTGKVSYEVQAFLGVDPEQGVFAADTFVPKNYLGRQHGIVQNDVLFKRFLNSICQKILVSKENLNKNVYIVCNAPGSYIDSIKKKRNNLPSYHKLCAILKAKQLGVFLINTPSNSPQLNLAEFYNDELLYRANTIFHDAMVHSKEPLPHFRHKKCHNVLEKIVLASCQQLIKESTQTYALVRFVGYLNDMIHLQGANPI